MTSQGAIAERERMDQRQSAPSGEGVLTGAGGALPWSWVNDRIASSPTYWITLNHEDGPPHVSPVWGIWRDGVLYFGTDRGGHKTGHLASNPQVSVRLESDGDVAIVEGAVEQVQGRELALHLADAYAAKYGWRPDPRSSEPLFALRPRVTLAWREQDILGTATRWHHAIA